MPGDALLTDAFGRMAAVPLPPDRVLAAVALAARAAGAAGMVGRTSSGPGRRGRTLSRAELVELNAKKTGALIAAACECGATLAGADPARRAALRRFGEELGIAFQITDDILDVVGDETEVGKEVRHDAQSRQSHLARPVGPGCPPAPWPKNTAGRPKRPWTRRSFPDPRPTFCV